MKKTIVYLDIDGVLNNAGTFIRAMLTKYNNNDVISLENLANFLHLVKKIEPEVYIHSSWRNSMTRDQIVECLERHIPYDYSFIKANVPRWKMSSEVYQDVREHLKGLEADGDVGAILILDDNPFRFEKTELATHFHQTNGQLGLTSLDLEAIADFLSERGVNYNPPVILL